jgi:hypothetical protein
VGLRDGNLGNEIWLEDLGLLAAELFASRCQLNFGSSSPQEVSPSDECQTL